MQDSNNPFACRGLLGMTTYKETQLRHLGKKYLSKKGKIFKEILFSHKKWVAFYSSYAITRLAQTWIQINENIGNREKEQNYWETMTCGSIGPEWIKYTTLLQPTEILESVLNICNIPS